VPHCCQYIGAFQDSKQIYIVMEHAPGGDLLEQLLKEGRAMTEKRVVREVRAEGGRLWRGLGTRGAAGQRAGAAGGAQTRRERVPCVTHRAHRRR
jgi:hypothetical protein